MFRSCCFLCYETCSFEINKVQEGELGAHNGGFSIAYLRSLGWELMLAERALLPWTPDCERRQRGCLKVWKHRIVGVVVWDYPCGSGDEDRDGINGFSSIRRLWVVFFWWTTMPKIHIEGPGDLLRDPHTTREIIRLMGGNEDEDMAPMDDPQWQTVLGKVIWEDVMWGREAGYDGDNEEEEDGIATHTSVDDTLAGQRRRDKLTANEIDAKQGVRCWVD
ncbi:uncharacterized protein EV420DRAFT_1486600 [Desarmillaria tabescens]|uniref:Uncharacterized protein n=1 Tax=Armillaria tabescens TaxID=1929756 RepID=A0AA39JB37_ARMTA|nr:uncharacterized protein EV420DRAFT_1486600 [Desarmillaria tabescens]KAK0438720.1 hypothetical protein EV420DRAFT_1486600 [Desarmillaria tabescens]